MKPRVGMRLTTRWLVFATVLTLLLGLQGAVALAATADPEALQIRSIAMSTTATDLTVRIGLENAGKQSITEFGLALAFYDQAGDRLFAYPMTQAGYIDEISFWYYTADPAIEAGDTYQTEDTFAGYQLTGRMDVAIRYYILADGAYVMLPESEWLWYSSNGDADTLEGKREYYRSPKDSVVASIQDIDPGYHYYLLDDYNASAYGFSQGGEWIDEITVGALADKAGLKVGDLVVTIDGDKPTENLFAAEYALAKIADGKSADWVYERDGENAVASLELAE